MNLPISSQTPVDDASHDEDSSTQRASLVDHHVGARIRERRTTLGLSQQQLARMIGVTYQQAHKYERGLNRISAGRLFEIAPEVLSQNFQVNTMALLHLARRLAPAMMEAGEGAIIVTGNTSALRGKAKFAGFAPTKAA